MLRLSMYRLGYVLDRGGGRRSVCELGRAFNAKFGLFLDSIKLMLLCFRRRTLAVGDSDSNRTISSRTVMTSISGSDGERGAFVEWMQLEFISCREGDELWPLSETGVNQDSDIIPSNIVPSEHNKNNLESFPENAPAMTVARVKRPRSPDWSAEEKRAYLELKVEAPRTVKGKDWDFISQGLWERHKFKRSSKCCEDLWGTLRKAYKAIRGHEISKSDPQTSNWVSYWEMDEDGRSRNKLPRLFPLEWCNMIERILAAQENRSGKKSRGIAIPTQESIGAHDEDNDTFGDGSKQQSEGERPRMTDRLRADRPNSKYAGRKGSSVIIEEDPLVKQQVEDAVNSAVKRTLGCRFKRPGATTEDNLITKLSTCVKQLVEDAVNYALQLLACKKIFGAAVDEDDLMIRLPPNIFNKLIEDALSSALQPVSSALQVRDQDEQEYQKKFRAIEDRRRALDREELSLKRQRVGGHRQRTRRTSSNQQERRVKNYFGEGAIPA